MKKILILLFSLPLFMACSDEIVVVETEDIIVEHPIEGPVEEEDVCPDIVVTGDEVPDEVIAVEEEN